MLAIDTGIIPDGSNLHAFQIECTNIVMEHAGDVLVVSLTGSRKSLVWLLPLLAQQGGVSLVITPYTSLGLDSEIRCAVILPHFHFQC
jgi:superfamily II DNA helicase RecQ